MCLSQGKEKMADMRRKVLSRNSKSDHLTIVNAYQVLNLSVCFLVFLSAVCIDPLFIIQWLARAGRKQNSMEAGMKGSTAGITSCLPIHSRWARQSVQLSWENKTMITFMSWLLRGWIRTCSLLNNLSFYDADVTQHERSICWASDAYRLCQQPQP